MPDESNISISTPDPTMQELFAAFIRAFMLVMGTFGVSVNILANADAVWALAGGLSMLVGVGWSIWQKFESARLAHASAVVSAKAGQALKTSVVLFSVITSLAFISACQLPATEPDPSVIAKINYVCVYSGLFKFVDTAAASVIPVPGAVIGVGLINAGITNACLHPDTVAANVGVVENLIAQFKAEGKM